MLVRFEESEVGVHLVFEQAWEVVKAPIDVLFPRGGRRVIEDDEMLFSGGDIRDSPRYYSTDIDAALHYALYGSAIPYADYKGKRDDKGQTRPPLRATVPSISVIDPRHYSNYNDEGMYDSSIMPLMLEDPFSPGFGVIDEEGGSGERLSHDKVIELLEEYLNEERYRGAMGGTTGDIFTAKERAKHANSALKRLIAYRDNESLERFNPNPPTYQMKDDDVFRTTEYDDFVDSLRYDDMPSEYHGEWDGLTDWQKEAAKEAGYSKEVWDYD